MPDFPEWFKEIQKRYPVWGCTCHELRAGQEKLQRLRQRSFADGTRHFLITCTGCHKTSAWVRRSLVPEVYHDQVPEWELPEHLRYREPAPASEIIHDLFLVGP